MSVTTKLGVDVSGFTQGINAARASLKTMDAALKQNEAQLRATGDKEAYLQQKTELLSTKMQIQEKVIKDTEKALKRMADAGVKPADAEFQKMQQRLLDAQTGLMNTTTELNTLTAGEQAAAAGADKLGQSMSSIGQKMSLQQVIGGVQSVTGWLESAAKKAVELGQALMGTVLDSASWADDTMTLATVLGLDQDTVQRMNMVAVEFEADAATIGGVWKKLRMNMTSDSASVAEAFEQLGVATKTVMQGKDGPVVQGMRDYQDVFWETGEALMKMAQDGTKAAEVERLAQATLGRGWDELRPLFEKGREAYEEALKSQTPVSEDAMANLAELNDKYQELINQWNVLKGEALGKLAPALTAGAEALSTLLTKVTDYLQTEKGQEMLEKMGKAVEGLFSDLSSIDPQQVVEGFTGVFNSVVSGLEWLTNNKQTVIDALKAIVIGWGTLKLTGGALQLLNLVNGLISLNGKNIKLPGLDSGNGGDGTKPTGDGTAPTGSGNGGGPGWLDTMKLKVTEAVTQGVEKLGGTAGLFNGSFAVDYLLHNTEVGRAINPEYGGDISKLPGAVGEAATGWFENIKKNLSDWYETASSVFSPTVEFWKQYWGNWETEHSATESRLFDPQQLQSEWDAFFGGNKKLEVPTEPQLPTDTTEELEKQVGVLEIPARVVLDWFTGVDGGGDHGFANGLPFVPYDNYPALLHKGERVVPAREINNSRSFSSNLYVESMIMNNGTDAEGLAAAIAAANQRTMSGFGS